MSRSRTLLHVASYQLQYALAIAAAFVVTPAFVRGVGEESYGLWGLILSATTYLAALDHGLNAAVVRLLSMHRARSDAVGERSVVATVTAIRVGLAIVVAGVLAVIGYCLPLVFDVGSFDPGHVRTVFAIAALDVLAGLLLSGYLGTLTALRAFVPINSWTATITLVRSGILLVALSRGVSLTTVAWIMLSATLLRHLGHYVLLRRTAPELRFERGDVRSPAAEAIGRYAGYAILIALAIRLGTCADGLVIGSFLTVRDVSFYSIPAAVLEHMERLVVAGSVVLVPLVSARDATGDVDQNRSLYIEGTRWSLIVLIPAWCFLLLVGDRFLGWWVGPEFADRSSGVLRVLLGAYALSIPQVVAHGILKGTSRHRFLAFGLLVQVGANVALSCALVRPLGLFGVALGTAIPLLAWNLVALPVYTSRVLGLNWLEYLRHSHGRPALVLAATTAALGAWRPELSTAGGLLGYGLVVACVAGLFTLVFGIRPDERARLRATVLRRVVPPR